MSKMIATGPDRSPGPPRLAVGELREDVEQVARNAADDVADRAHAGAGLGHDVLELVAERHLLDLHF
jgi:hypothetical protein